MEQTSIQLRPPLADVHDGPEEDQSNRDSSSVIPRIANRTVVPDVHIRVLIDKDRCLIEAALATDKRVASLDDKVRNHLKDHRSTLPEIAPICWVNPDIATERGVAWLESGAPADRSRTLGYGRGPNQPR
jgi:hypothetical protein